MILALELVVGLALVLFGYRFIRLFAPFVFFGSSLYFTYQWAASFSDNVLVVGALTAIVGVTIGVLMASLSSLLISLSAFLISAVVAFFVLDMYVLQALGVPDVIAGVLTVLVIVLFLAMAVGTFMMRYIGIFVSAFFGSYALFIVFNELAEIAPSDRFDVNVAGPWLMFSCVVIALLGVIMQLRQHRANQRPLSERGMWSLQQYSLDT